MPASRNRSPKQRAWATSAEWRAIGTGALLKFHAERHLHPCCGAKAKSTGLQCRALPAPGSTRCRLHGGATPKGRNWHTPGFPGGMPTGKARSDAQKRRRKRQQDERRAGMTSEQRARHEAWHAAHEPGPAAKRQRRRQDREAAKLLKGLLQGDGRSKRAPARQKPVAAAERPASALGGVFD